MKWPEHGLRWKISVFLSVAVLLVMVLLSVGDYLWQRHAFLDTLNAHIEEEARLVTALVSNARSPDEVQYIFQNLVPALDAPTTTDVIHEIFLIDSQGIILAANVPGTVGRHMWNHDIAEVLSGGAEQRFGVMWHDDHLSYYGVFPIARGGTPDLVVHIAEPYAPILSQMQRFLGQRLMFMGLVTLVLILATIAATDYIILRPLGRLAATIEQVSRGDLNTRVIIERADELGSIGRAFNRMVEALRRARQSGEEKHRRLALLYEINRRLAGVSDWETLVNLILHLPEEIIPLAGAMFLSYNERTRRFALEGAWGLSNTTLAALEQHLSHMENPACLTCPSCFAHLESNCPLLVPGLLCDERDRVVCLHLAQGDRTVGFLYLFLASDTPLPPAKVELLNAVGGEITAAVAAAQARARELALLASIEGAHHSPTSIHESLHHILEQVADAGQSQRGAVFLYETETQHLLPVAWLHVRAEEMDEWRGLAWQGLHHREPMVLTRRSFSASRPEHVAVVPLHLHGEALGALVLSTSRADAYTRHHLMFFSAIATQTALMVQTARLYERLEQQAILEERARLAREIHDGLAQSLAFVRWKMYQIERWVDQGEHERLRDELATLKQVVDEAYLDAREAIEGLRLPVDEHRSFADTLREYTRRFVARTGITVDLSLEDVALPAGAQAQLLRVVQEALTNVRKHAQAEHVTVALYGDEEGLHLTVEDDGVGFDPTVAVGDRRFGLRIMAERVQGLGGRLHVSSRPGHGTVLDVFLPTPHIRVGERRNEEGSRVDRG